MPRKPRHDEAGAVHHVYARGVDGRAIFGDDRDRQAYLDLLGYVVRRWKWDCLGYCLMTNHVHLVVRTSEPTLGCGMQYLHSFYALAYNQKYGRVGHLFQTRYGSSRLRTPARLRRALDYVAENPVEASLCREPIDWPWNSVAVLAGNDVPQWLARTGRIAQVQAELAADS